MWFFFALITMLCWGTADLFYKKGADDSDRYSHLKTAVMVGAVMGIHAIVTLIFSDVNYDFTNILRYLPVSICYILSMVVGYFGLRYLELSIASPIQNASGAVACLLCVLILGQKLDLWSSVAITIICLAVFFLGVFERQEIKGGEKKYKIGFAAFFMPLVYCLIDALGTFFDGYYLDDVTTTPLVGVNEENFELVANISYELTFLICAIVLFVYLRFIRRESFPIRLQGPRALAAVLETAGQFTYVYAISGNAAIAAPMIAAYCIVSVILSRIFEHEKLTAKKYAMVFLVILGIIILGIVEA